MWCQSTEFFIQENDRIPGSLHDCLEENQQQINALTTLVKGDLEKIQRITIISLITTDVHARDIV